PEAYQGILKDVFINNEVWLGIRPEHIELNESVTDGLVATIGVLEPIGSDTFVYIDFPADKTMIVKIEGLAIFKLDQEVSVTFKEDQIHFFNSETEQRINPYDESEEF
ncbi:MAG: TOBE domain-containing protein, partial [Candidatus Hodarchaeales archaeon]